MRSGRAPVVLRVGLLLLLAVVAAVLAARALDPGGGDGGRGGPTAGPAVPGEAQRGVVLRIVDGDTLHLRVTSPGPVRRTPDLTVRLLEIDTPETGASGGAPECFAEEATSALDRLAPVGSTVRFTPDRDVRDDYGRTLLYLWNEDGTFVNQVLVERGYARAVLFEPNDRHIAGMRAAEERARSGDRGLWGAC